MATKFDKRQQANGVRVMRATRKWCKAESIKNADHVRYLARLCIQCCLDESDLYIYASHKVAGSAALPHDKFGSDHLSVGMFQQQVPMWGSVKRCQTPESSTTHFLNALKGEGMAGPSGHGPAARHRIQTVQRSFDSSGANYGAQADRAVAFVTKYYKRSALPVHIVKAPAKKVVAKAKPKSKPKPAPKHAAPKTPPMRPEIAAILKWQRGHQGSVPYSESAGTRLAHDAAHMTSATDCSGMVARMFAHFAHINVGTYTGNECDYGTLVHRNKPKAAVGHGMLPGDVIFFDWGPSHYSWDHVAIYAGGGRMWNHGGPNKGPINISIGDRYMGVPAARRIEVRRFLPPVKPHPKPHK